MLFLCCVLSCQGHYCIFCEQETLTNMLPGLTVRPTVNILLAREILLYLSINHTETDLIRDVFWSDCSAITLLNLISSHVSICSIQHISFVLQSAQNYFHYLNYRNCSIIWYRILFRYITWFMSLITRQMTGPGSLNLNKCPEGVTTAQISRTNSWPDTDLFYATEMHDGGWIQSPICFTFLSSNP